MEAFVQVDKPIPYLVIKKWEQENPNLSVGFSTRQGGQSKGNYRSMNLALHVGDDPTDVVANHQILARALGFSFDAWTSAEQVHGNNIKVVTLAERGKGRRIREDAIQDTDGLVTNIPDIVLTVYFADCVPIYFYDPIKQIIGLAHSGWKGTVLKIAEKMIQTFVDSFQSNVNDIQVAIGPAIGQCCYEVNDQVINPMQSSLQFIPPEMVIDKKNGHFDLDLKKINKEILLEAGILPENIEISSWCTNCNVDLFFSHRKEQGKTGRMAAWIGLRKDE
ncbi:MAG: peptidoglycan editing factor PgeF [Tepidibacillus sp.]